MNVLVTGGKDFNDPLVFRRAMGVVMSDLGSEPTLTLMLAGPYKTNEIARQFVNLAEESFKARGKKINYVHVNPAAVAWDTIDMVVSLVYPPQRNTALGFEAESRGIDVNVFRF